MKDKKLIVHHAIALGILVVGFILCRYIFFDIHGMKEFSKVLLILGLIVMAISALCKKKVFPYFIPLGYIVGFVFGFIFQVTKIDANGVSVNNLWVIWAVVNVTFIAIGIICEWFFSKYAKVNKLKKSKAVKAVIGILGVIVIWLCVGITDFALVTNYKKPLFCIGVDLADDGGSGKYAGLGYSFEIEGNFMPEDKESGITSYRGYILEKEVCRGFWERMLAD